MSSVASRDGTSIAFDRSGQGPAVVLVGGALQQRTGDARTDRLAALLGRRFTVVNHGGFANGGWTGPFMARWPRALWSS